MPVDNSLLLEELRTLLNGDITTNQAKSIMTFAMLIENILLAPVSTDARINVSYAGDAVSDVPGSAIRRAGAGPGVSTFTASRACRVTAISVSLSTALGEAEEIGIRIVTDERAVVTPDLTLGEGDEVVFAVLSDPIDLAPGEVLQAWYESTELSNTVGIIVDVEVMYL